MRIEGPCQSQGNPLQAVFTVDEIVTVCADEREDTIKHKKITADRGETLER